MHSPCLFHEQTVPFSLSLPPLPVATSWPFPVKIGGVSVGLKKEGEREGRGEGGRGEKRKKDSLAYQVLAVLSWPRRRHLLLHATSKLLHIVTTDMSTQPSLHITTITLTISSCSLLLR